MNTLLIFIISTLGFVMGYFTCRLIQGFGMIDEKTVLFWKDKKKVKQWQ